MFLVRKLWSQADHEDLQGVQQEALLQHVSSIFKKWKTTSSG